MIILTFDLSCSIQFYVNSLKIAMFRRRKTLLGKVFTSLWGHSFNTYAKFFEKLTFLTPPSLMHRQTCAYQGLRNVSFPESFAYVLNEWSLCNTSKIVAKTVMNLHDILTRYWKVTNFFGSNPFIILTLRANASNRVAQATFDYSLHYIYQLRSIVCIFLSFFFKL